MNRYLTVPLMAFGLSAVALSANASSAGSVLDACIRGADLSPAAVETTEGQTNGTAYARVEAGGPVSAPLARAINDCADRHGGNTTVVTTTTLSTSGHTASGTTNPRRRPPYFDNADPFPQWRSARQCNDTPTYIYRGNLYCFAGR